MTHVDVRSPHRSTSGPPMSPLHLLEDSVLHSPPTGFVSMSIHGSAPLPARGMRNTQRPRVKLCAWRLTRPRGCRPLCRPRPHHVSWPLRLGRRQLSLGRILTEPGEVNSGRLNLARPSPSVTFESDSTGIGLFMSRSFFQRRKHSKVTIESIDHPFVFK
jgi:hypothetical protein